ncbi:MAG: four helix bundle protein [Candidatus Omnitrophica bacterium]|nr:four helix bundle protein [Candidatus Omnitrophota bacterium]
MRFVFEDLEVWKKAVDFAKEVIDTTNIIETDRKHYRLLEQLESAATSIPMNIAEGKGRFSKKEFIQFLYIARGSLNETITLLIIFNKNNWITERSLESLKNKADEIGKMISSLINSIKKSI